MYILTLHVAHVVILCIAASAACFHISAVALCTLLYLLSRAGHPTTVVVVAQVLEVHDSEVLFLQATTVQSGMSAPNSCEMLHLKRSCETCRKRSRLYC